MRVTLEEMFSSLSGHNPATTRFVVGLFRTPLEMKQAISALVFSFVLNTKRIIRWQRGFINFLVKFLWLIAFSYDVFTSWLGNANLLVGSSSTSSAIIILIGLTLLVSASPILLSGMWQKTDSPPATSREVRAS